MGLHMLAVLLSAGRGHPGAPRFFEQKIQEAQRILAIRYHEELSMEQLARELSVSYSSFRQAFKAQTGISPKQYQIQIRLNKARDFLASTTKSIGEISEILGFDSGFHFSKQFKDATGLSPLTWRKRLGGLRAESRAKTQRIN
jgi:transcriptional regulator GlxA family with amidase domain